MNTTQPFENPTSKWHWPTLQDEPYTSFDGKECLIMDHLLDRIKRCIEIRDQEALDQAIGAHLSFSQACFLRTKIVDAIHVHNPTRNSQK